MGSVGDKEYSTTSQHYSILQNVLESSSVADSLVRSYTRSFNGFAVKLTDQERDKLASMNGVVSVFPSRILQLQTTRSWDFMGFPQNVKRKHNVESNVIVGVIDTGIWPESDSFSDEGFGPPPSKWKGVCRGGENFTCNNKIIGARYYNSPYFNESFARDDQGHGTHTASTAAGNEVIDTSFYGFARGTARGGVPSARIAVYRVCHVLGCPDTEILAAFDDAISDGVDIITISVGGPEFSLFEDSIAIGSFHAIKRGILTVQAAGNDGPGRSKVFSTAPWMVSVAASSTDRRIIDNVLLGDGTILTGSSVNTFVLNGTMFPLVYGKDVSRHCNESSAWECDLLCLENHLVKGKIVVCNGVESESLKMYEVDRAGALGAIIPSNQANSTSFIASLPVSFIDPKDLMKLMSYINSTKVPKANILRSEVVKDLTAPVVASFSSRGPNSIIPEILKPDLSAPGIDILAAFAPTVSPSAGIDDRRVKYSLLSGTSMACPHVAGAAAYVKTFHPHWSPSAIHSALVTTARPMKASINPDREFAYGSGHINPVQAVHPGLVYEASKEDYIQMLCSMGYNVTMIRLISGNKTSCPENDHHIRSPKDLNYPSMAIKVNISEAFKVEFPRRVTNVGRRNTTYKAKVVTSSSDLSITIKPNILSFKSVNEKKSFLVTVSSGKSGVKSLVSASLVLFDGTHSVRSPIVVYTESDT